jgi:hypothetical protein
VSNVLTRFEAPWCSRLRTVTVLVGVMLVAMFAIGLMVHQPIMVVVAVLVMLLPIPWAVLGFTLTPDAIEVVRPGWTLRLPLKALQSVTAEPTAMRGSIRLMGNGGLYAFTGLYRSDALGRYRAYVTDPARAVVLRYPDRTVVVTPDQPERFVQRVRHAAGLG